MICFFLLSWFTIDRKTPCFYSSLPLLSSSHSHTDSPHSCTPRTAPNTSSSLSSISRGTASFGAKFPPRSEFPAPSLSDTAGKIAPSTPPFLAAKFLRCPDSAKSRFRRAADNRGFTIRPGNSAWATTHIVAIGRSRTARPR